MNEESKGNIGGNLSAGSTDQKGKGSPNVFHTEGLQHFNYSPKIIVTVGLVSFVFTIIVGTLMGYKSAVSEIDTGIQNNRELNRKLDKHDYDIQTLKDETTEIKEEQKSINCLINRGKHCK